MGKDFTVEVAGDDPRDAAPPLFSNFVGISRAGTEIQFEFIFLDLNLLAKRAEAVSKGDVQEGARLDGQTVAKLVIPMSVFMQLKAHLSYLFDQCEVVADGAPKEKTQERKDA